MAKTHLRNEWGRGECGVGHRGNPTLTEDPGEVTCLSCQSHLEDEMRTVDEIVDAEAWRKARGRARSRAVSVLVERHADEFETLRVGFEEEMFAEVRAEVERAELAHRQWQEEWQAKERAKLEAQLKRLGG